MDTSNNAPGQEPVDQTTFTEHLHQLKRKPVQTVLPGIGDQPGDTELFHVEEVRTRKDKRLLAQSVYYRDKKPKYTIKQEDAS
jgi:hypothetical protein